MAQQQAVLIGGTGYQYGDTDFLEYSERLYLGITQRLREGPVGRLAAGRGGTRARSRQAGLPGRRHHPRGHRPEGRAPGHAVRPADDRLRRSRPRAARVRGLPRPRPTRSTRARRDPRARDPRPGRPARGPRRRRRRSGAGSSASPPSRAGARARRCRRAARGAGPAQAAGERHRRRDRVLRGVGFRGGDYTDTPGLLPLTGAPAIEGSTTNTTFESPTSSSRSGMTPPTTSARWARADAPPWC